MTKFILILLLISTAIWANDETDVELIAKQINDIVEIKAYIKSPMRGKKEAEERSKKPDFITHVSAEVNKQIVFEVFTCANIPKNPIFRFKFKNIANADKMDLLITTNEGHQRKGEFSIPETLKTIRHRSLLKTLLLKTDTTKINSKVFEATTVDKAIAELYGSVVNPIEGKIKIVIPEMTPTAVVPINISSDIDLESLAVFSDKLEEPAIAIFSISPLVTIDYDLKTIVRDWDIKRHSIIVIGKGRDGKFYKTVKEGGIFHNGESCG